MNSQPYGIAKQLYRTSYSPSVTQVRPSSLNPVFSQSHIAHPPMIRLEQPTSSSVIRELPRNNLSISQVNPQELGNKMPLHDYYPEPKREDMSRSLQQRIEEISKRVSKNTEEIKNMKQIGKSDQNMIQEFTQQLNITSRQQEGKYQECLEQIKTVREQLTYNDCKTKKNQSDGFDKLVSKFDDKQMFRFKGLIEERVKQETSKIKLIIDNEISKASHELRWEMDKQKHDASPFRSKLKYPFKTIKIVYSQFLQTTAKGKTSSRTSTKESLQSPRSGKMLMKSEQIYYIDRQGFLLDEDSYYILDSEQKMIRLSSTMLDQLRGQGLLEQK